MLIETILLLIISKKINKYAFVMFLITIAYFVIYHQNSFSSPINHLYSSIQNQVLMPEIIDKVPF